MIIVVAVSYISGDQVNLEVVGKDQPLATVLLGLELVVV